MSTATPTTDNPGPLIWVKCHNEAARDADLIVSEALRLERLKPNKTRRALMEALFSSFAMLRNEAHTTANHARINGLLLFCWPGTKVLEGGAA